MPNGATIALAADPTNFARGLMLLQDAKLLTLDVKSTDKGLDYAQITEKNITANPKNLKFVEIDRPQLPATLDDAKVTVSVINGANALEAGLKPATEALQLESATDNPYANVLAVKDTLKDDPRVAKLAEALLLCGRSFTRATQLAPSLLQPGSKRMPGVGSSGGLP